MSSRQKRGSVPEAEAAPIPKAPRRGKARGKGLGADAASCGRCDEPVDRETCARGVAGGRGTQQLFGCDQCYVTFERHYQQEMPWQDCCERCRADESFNADFDKHVEADRQLAEALSAAHTESGSVEVDVFYGQEISKTSVQLTQQQWTEQVCPPGIVGVTPEFAQVEQTRVPSSSQPWVSSTGVVVQHPDKPYTEIKNYTRTEVKMSTLKISPAGVSKAGGDFEVF